MLYKEQELNKYFDTIQNEIKNILSSEHYQTEDVEKFNNYLVIQNQSAIKAYVKYSFKKKVSSSDVANKLIDEYFNKTEFNLKNKENRIEDYPNILNGETGLNKLESHRIVTLFENFKKVTDNPWSSFYTDKYSRLKDIKEELEIINKDGIDYVRMYHFAPILQGDELNTRYFGTGILTDDDKKQLPFPVIMFYTHLNQAERRIKPGRSCYTVYYRLDKIYPGVIDPFDYLTTEEYEENKINVEMQIKLISTRAKKNGFHGIIWSWYDYNVYRIDMWENIKLKPVKNLSFVEYDK